MYVIYSETETQANPDLGPAFWNNDEGWTTLDNATIFPNTEYSIPYDYQVYMSYGDAVEFVSKYEPPKDTEVE